MRHYKITDDLRREVNNFLGSNYIGKKDLGHELYHLKNYENIARVAPRKARLLMATLFPETVRDARYLSSHSKQIGNLAKKLNADRRNAPPFSWSNYTIRDECLPPLEGPSYKDPFWGNMVRFR